MASSIAARAILGAVRARFAPAPALSSTSTSLSSAPAAVRAVGARLATVSLAQCRDAAEAALASSSAADARAAAAAVLLGQFAWLLVANLEFHHGGEGLIRVRPTDAEIEWAGRVITAARAGGVVSVDGKMVDRPVVLRAEDILARTAAPHQ